MTLELVEEDVLDAEMVSVEALKRISVVFGIGEALLEIREEDPSLDSGIGILETLQNRSEGSVGGVSGLLALLQELIHRSHHSHFAQTHTLFWLFVFVIVKEMMSFFLFSFPRKEKEKERMKRKEKERLKLKVGTVSSVSSVFW